MRGATTAWRSHCSPSRNFNPRSSCEERLYRLRFNWNDTSFQSTLLMRGATSLSYLLMSAVARFQSTLLMRGATCDDGFRDVFAAISIHAPHARSDMPSTASARRPRFQSTLLMRGATSLKISPVPSVRDFNPRSSCEERLTDPADLLARLVISIHAPHARSDDHLRATVSM